MAIEDLEFKASLVAYGAGQVYGQLPEFAKERYREAIKAYYDGINASIFVERTPGMKVKDN